MTISSDLVLLTPFFLCTLKLDLEFWSLYWYISEWVKPVIDSTIFSSGFKALGTKRLASDEVHDWDNKRLNAGQVSTIQV